MNTKYVEFEILGEIKTKQRPRAAIIGGQARVYTPKDTIYYENYIKTMYQEKYKDFSFKNKPLAFTIHCYFKANNQIAEKIEDEHEAAELPCTTHKDLDNIAKTVLDSLNGIAFNDDKQITELRCFKDYTLNSERIVVMIEDITEEYKYRNLQHYKDLTKSIDLAESIINLINKRETSKNRTLNKADAERLERLQKQRKELLEKIERDEYND